MLLSGPGGTGKTLTAEAGTSNRLDGICFLLTEYSVAERTQKPLMRLQAENLGSSVGSFSSSLAEAFDLATEWGAVMLLDGKPVMKQHL
jgi:AAA+ superfamily predicted ATPase